MPQLRGFWRFANAYLKQKKKGDINEKGFT